MVFIEKRPHAFKFEVFSYLHTVGSSISHLYKSTSTAIFMKFSVKVLISGLKPSNPFLKTSSA